MRTPKIHRHTVWSFDILCPIYNPTYLNHSKLNSNRLNQTQLGLKWLNSTQVNSIQLDSTQLDSTQINSAHLDSTQLDMTWVTPTWHLLACHKVNLFIKLATKSNVCHIVWHAMVQCSIKADGACNHCSCGRYYNDNRRTMAWKNVPCHYWLAAVFCSASFWWPMNIDGSTKEGGVAQSSCCLKRWWCLRSLQRQFVI